MSESYQELEVKLLVSDLAPISARLEELQAVITAPLIFERNVRYENAEGTFEHDGIVLRLRQDKAVRLTYKEPASQDASAHGLHKRFEAEVTVSDYEAMHMILTRLGFHPYMTYEKYRTTYELDEAEIVLDEMPYGAFVEIEARDEATIDRLVEKLKLTDAPRISYSYTVLFDHIRHHLNLTFNDLTFDNFEGITVPETAFQPPR